ncbi:hypothetical protein SNEBB_005787 [Seison nebaliae]|nr:hypothetical protein SNEBB_005787 [Seison nebaliae]
MELRKYKGLPTGGGTKMLWGFLWFIFIIIIAYPLAFCAIIIYVLLQPFSSCMHFIQEISFALLEVAHLPRVSADALLAGLPMV